MVQHCNNSRVSVPSGNIDLGPLTQLYCLVSKHKSAAIVSEATGQGRLMSRILLVSFASRYRPGASSRTDVSVVGTPVAQDCKCQKSRLMVRAKRKDFHCMLIIG